MRPHGSGGAGGRGGRLVITPATHPRAGREESFTAVPATDEDRAIGIANRFDDEEWTW
jgi:hypothetical protein